MKAVSRSAPTIPATGPRPASVRSRDGIQAQFQTPTGDAPITGLVSLINDQSSGKIQAPVIFDLNGRMYKESPAGSGTLVAITDSNGLASLPTGSHMQAAAAYNRGYFAFSDLLNPSNASQPAVLDLPTGNLDPYSMRPVGDRWKANTIYKVGEVVTPNTGTTGDGHTYRCTTAGTSGATQPSFNSTTGATTNDGTVVWMETTGVMSSSASAGNICTGQRFMVVLFKNRNGYITGMTEASVQGFNVVTASRKLQIDHIPAGPANTAARVLCFTVAGGTTVGDYFYIPSPDSVSGVAIDSTIINDNTTTSVTLNFTDIYLLSATKVTSFFRKIQAPSAIDIYFSETMQRLVLSGVAGFSGSHLVSLANDPESFYGDTGVVTPGQTDGQTTVCWRDFKGVSYSLRSRSGYIVEAASGDPSTWSLTKKWDQVGPCGPRAVDAGASFMCFVHRSGVYIFTGDVPFRITKEIPVTWRRINWDVQHLIWVNIDEETQEVRIGVPLDNSTVPNAILKCNYEEAPDFAPPIYFSPFVGREVAAGAARKWSIDDISAFVCQRVERKVTGALNGGLKPLSGEDALTRQSQIMFGSSNPDGVASAIAYGTFSDVTPSGAVGFNSIYETVSTQDLMRVNQLGGLSVNATGFGDLYADVLFGRRPAGAPGKISLSAIKLTDTQDKAPPSVGARGQNERFRIRFSNGAQPGFWFDIKYAALYARPVASSR